MSDNKNQKEGEISARVDWALRRAGHDAAEADVGFLQSGYRLTPEEDQPKPYSRDPRPALRNAQ